MWSTIFEEKMFYSVVWRPIFGFVIAPKETGCLSDITGLEAIMFSRRVPCFY